MSGPVAQLLAGGPVSGPVVQLLADGPVSGMGGQLRGVGPLAVSEGYVAAAVLVTALALGIYLVVTARRTAGVARRLDELEARLAAGERPEAEAPGAPARPGTGALDPAGGPSAGGTSTSASGATGPPLGDGGRA